MFVCNSRHRALAMASMAASVCTWCALPAVGAGKGGHGSARVMSTLQDFFQPGTQPNGDGLPVPLDPLLSAGNCFSCHAEFGPTDPFLMVEEMKTWAASMMGQSVRDPVFRACMAIANQDAANGGQYCIRCHAPSGFLRGHSVPTDGSALDYIDQQGINCNFCHRLVDPVYVAGISPPQDQQIVNDLISAGLLPPEGSNSRYTIDPTDARRGPFNNVPMNLHPGNPQPQIIYSPIHQTAQLCWNCHDVSNPLMSRQADGTYTLNGLDQPHPTANQHDMLPLHRTYSEWKNSYYSSIGVQHNGRFGGNHATGIMKDCQDCHMPDTIGYGCNFEFEPFFQRPDVPQHSFIGSNYWVLNAIRAQDADGDGHPDYPDSDTYMSDEGVDAAIERNIDFLKKASDLELSLQGSNLNARIINRTGHKLPTGFPDGRRIWINVRFLDCNGDLILEHGAYDFETATLNATDTKVYEMHLGIQGVPYAKMIGLPQGPTFHFMLANTIVKDNRIPPSGFSNFIAHQMQTESIGATYVNGQNWDDTLFAIPKNSRRAVVSVNYQLTSREFIEFLRDTNSLPTPNDGTLAYDLWALMGMSAPVTIDMEELIIPRPEDINHDGAVNVDDLLRVINAWGSCPPAPSLCPADIDHNGFVNVDDLLLLIAAWGSC